MSEIYFNDLNVLAEFENALKATTSTTKERFALRVCRWLMEVTCEVITEEIIKLPPKKNEIAALYKMIISATLEEKELNIYIDGAIERGKAFSEIYYTWIKLARGSGKAFPFTMLPGKTGLTCENGMVYEFGAGRTKSLVNYDGTLTKKVHKIIDIDEHWYKLILSGKKKVEGKKGSPSWIDIKEGDFVYFKSGEDTSFVRIKEIRKYTTIRSYLEQEGLRHTLPGVETIQEGIDIYMNPPISWTEEEVAKYGVLAIEFD